MVEVFFCWIPHITYHHCPLYLVFRHENNKFWLRQRFEKVYMFEAQIDLSFSFHYDNSAIQMIWAGGQIYMVTNMQLLANYKPSHWLHLNNWYATRTYIISSAIQKISWEEYKWIRKTWHAWRLSRDPYFSVRTVAADCLTALKVRWRSFVYIYVNITGTLRVVMTLGVRCSLEKGVVFMGNHKTWFLSVKLLFRTNVSLGWYWEGIRLQRIQFVRKWARPTQHDRGAVRCYDRPPIY